MAERADRAPVPDALMAHERLVQGLMRPGALPAAPAQTAPAAVPTACPVRLVQTHLSSLLLTPDRVYKLKKPLRLDFVDFSSLAARHAACLKELALNHRTAPEVYQRVLPVVAGPDGPLIADPAQPLPADTPVLDWALQMRRFDEQQGLDQLAKRGALGLAQVEALGLEIARFHAAQPPSRAPFVPEGVAGITVDWAERNLADLARLRASDAAVVAQIAVLASWSRQRAAALAPRMTARARAGLVRELHGDLHLGNVVWQDGRPLLFDAIEFNDSLRHIDAVGDWSFTFMDLLARVGADAAWRLASTVVEASADHAALGLLRWWAVYRALVRAKVAWLGPAGEAAEAGARRYLGVAQALVQAEARPPWLVLTMGLSGSGKSRVAQGLLGRLGAVRLRSDVERKRLFGLAPQDRPTPDLGLYGPAATRQTYDRLLGLADQALSARVGVVVDAASLRQAERQAFAELARRHGARYRVLLCEAPEAVLRARIAARAAAGDDASDATEQVLALQQRVAEWPQADEASECWRLDTDASPDTVAARAQALPWDT